MSGTELDLAAGLSDALAHLQRHGVGEGVGLLMQQLGCLGDDHRPLGVGLVPPGLEADLGGRQLGLELRGADVVEALDQLAVKGTKALVGHWISLCDHSAPRKTWSGRRQASRITFSALVLAALPKVS